MIRHVLGKGPANFGSEALALVPALTLALACLSALPPSPSKCARPICLYWAYQTMSIAAQALARRLHTRSEIHHMMQTLHLDHLIPHHPPVNAVTHFVNTGLFNWVVSIVTILNAAHIGCISLSEANHQDKSVES